MTRPDPAAAARHIKVLGVGNLLWADEGFGVRCVEALGRDWEFPPEVELLDGGTLGLALLPYLQEAASAILVDAIRADGSPGALVRVEGSEVGPAVRERLSVHQVGVADLLDGARWLDLYPESVVLLGLVPESLELGVTLSPSVESQIPGLIARIIEEARSLGWPLTRKVHHEAVTSALCRAAAARPDGL